MKLEIPNCPQCGLIAKGTVEQVQGLALLGEIGGDGRCEYGGETKIWWDEQRTVLDQDGRATLVCHDGHQWQSLITEE
jgi:hypothetical protein